MDIECMNYEKDDLRNRIRDFNCGNNELNKFLKEADLHCVTTKVFVESSSKKIIGFCSFCCSCVLTKSDTTIEKFPAIEIKIFAIDESYHGKEFTQYPHRNRRKNMTIADYVLRSMIIYFDELSQNTISAKFIVLESTKKAMHFYSKNAFECFPDTTSILRDEFGRGCVPMFRTI